MNNGMTNTPEQISVEELEVIKSLISILRLHNPNELADVLSKLIAHHNATRDMEKDMYWRSVEDEQPESGQECLFLRGKSVHKGYYDDHNIHQPREYLFYCERTNHNSYAPYTDATHWMPLPQPIGSDSDE